MNTHHIISRIAIYLLALVLFLFGIYHFMQPRNLILFVPPFLPFGVIWVYFVGAAFMLVALAFVTNKMVKVAGYVLALLLFTFVLAVHLPNFMEAGDSEMQQIALISLLKDTALAGFALHIAAGAHHQKLHLEDSD